MNAVSSLLFYALAAVFEIGGSYALWMVLRLGKSPLWLVPGAISLFVFGLILTRIELEAAGRAYAAYGGIYVTASVIWLWRVEGRTPDIWDIAGTALVLAGSLVILLGRHNSP